MKTGLIVCVILAAVVLSNCTKDDGCIDYSQSPVIATNAPPTGTVHKDIPIDVFFNCFNGCGRFGFFQKDNNFLTDTLVIE